MRLWRVEPIFWTIKQNIWKEWTQPKKLEIQKENWSKLIFIITTTCLNWTNVLSLLSGIVVQKLKIMQNDCNINISISSKIVQNHHINQNLAKFSQKNSKNSRFSLKILDFSKFSAPSAPKIWSFMSQRLGVLCPKGPPLSGGSPQKYSDLFHWEWSKNC